MNYPEPPAGHRWQESKTRLMVGDRMKTLPEVQLVDEGIGAPVASVITAPDKHIARIGGHNYAMADLTEALELVAEEAV